MKSNELPNALVNFDQLPNSAYVRLPVMINLYGVSATTIWRYVGEGKIPNSVKLTPRTTCWNVGEIRKALAQNN
jgi:predicted DNA-binding transcriptional regulator AlpA